MSCSAWNKWSAKVLQCPFPKKETAQDCSIKHFQIKSIPFRPMPFHPYFMQILLSPHVIISSYCSQWLGHMIFTCKSVQPSHVNQYNQTPSSVSALVKNNHHAWRRASWTPVQFSVLLASSTPYIFVPSTTASLWHQDLPLWLLSTLPCFFVGEMLAWFVGEMSAWFVGGVS